MTRQLLGYKERAASHCQWALMLEPLDRYRRDSTLFLFTSKRLRDFIDPHHLLIQIDEQLDFSNHPEVIVRTLLFGNSPVGLA